MTLTLTAYKWTRFILWGIGTFGLAYGLPFFIESVFDIEMPELLYVILSFIGFGAGGLLTPLMLGKILFAQCPKCKKAMRFVKTEGSMERYECADCWEQHEIIYPKVKSGS